MLARWGQWALLLGTLWFLPLNTSMGLSIGRWYQDGMDSFVRGVGARTPIPTLAREHRPFLLPWSEAELQSGLLMLKESRLGPFRQVPEDPR